MNLNTLFYPKSIAIIGASTKPGNVGNDIVKNMVAGAYTGNIYPVNPKATELYGLKCYSNIGEIEHPIDVAIIVIPAAAVPEILTEAGKKNIPAAVIISSGFKETGAIGQELERKIQEIAAHYSITLLGPNCLGFINPEIALNASFAPLMPASGSIAFISQSGALCTAALDSVHESKRGFSKFISIGNKASIQENTLLTYLAKDETTAVIGMYSEALDNAPELIQTGRSILARSQSKPIIALKAGLTQAGASASASHTGSLGGSEAAYHALFSQGKIIQAKHLREFLNFLAAFDCNSLPEGNRVAIITNAGGPGVLATDTAVKSGLVLAPLTSETQEHLKKVLPASAGTHNPIDVLGDAKADRYEAALTLAVSDPHVDSLLVILTPQTMTEIEKTAEVIIDIKKKTSKPIVAVFAGDTLIKPGKKKLDAARVSVMQYPEEAAEALGALARLSRWKKEIPSSIVRFDDVRPEAVRDIFSRAKDENRNQLSETEAWSVLEAYGFPFLRSKTVFNKEEAQEATNSFHGKVALKIVSPDILHKSDAGGVMLNVDPSELKEAYEQLMEQVKHRMPNARLEGALIAEMAEPGGREIILGIKKESGLGTLLMFGLGGIYVETFKDVAFRFAPTTTSDIQEMMRETKTFPILEGARGQQGVHLPKLEESLARLSQLVTDFPEIEEVDINPLLAFPEAEKFKILDARIRIG